MEFTNKMAVTLSRLLYLYFNAIEKILRTSIQITGSQNGLQISLVSPGEQTIDQRIAKIDTARANLVDGLKAIDELREAAEENKRELIAALEKLEQIQDEKHSAENELEQLRRIAETDADALRKVVGIPSKSDIRKQQIIGFFGGVIASILATSIIWIGGLLI